MTTDAMNAQGHYHMVCYDPDGNERWNLSYPNTVTFSGKNLMLDTLFSGSAYTGSWLMSLITAGTATTASTYAAPIVTEVGTAVIAARLPVSWTASASGVKTANATTFNILSSATITGSMLVNNVTGATTPQNVAASGGVLFSAATFAAGSKAVSSGDQIVCSYNVSV